MNEEVKISNDKALIIAYLYDELSQERREAFAQRLETDVVFNSLYQQQLDLDKIIKQGTRPAIDNQRMDAVHWSLQKQLRKQANKRKSLFTAFTDLWSTQVSFKAQFASMLVTFTLGVLLAGGNWSADQPSSQLAEDNNMTTPLLSQNDFQITDLQLKNIGSNGDRVQVAYSLESHNQIYGSLANSDMQNLLATTLMNDVSDATRLDLIEVLKNYSQVKNVRDALSYSLLNDPNPGVRMVAAETLSQLSADKAVRNVLRSALQQDVNPGVRVQVFQVLTNYLHEKETRELLQNYSVKDSNLYIREQSRLLLEEQRRHEETQI